ncbi:hypothetical protein EYR38_010115 [Pleurotus pulmonarius]|nr:hypothetical protein EYR38_010115 [Pleurotus pulmonarius]
MADQTHTGPTNRRRQPNKDMQARPKPVPRQSELSAQIPEGQVINTILDTHVNLPVRQLLGTSRELTEELFSLMKYRNNKPPEVNELTAEVHSYSMADHNRGPLLRLPLTYNGKAVSAIIDTGSELNVINRKVFQDLIALPYDPNEPGAGANIDCVRRTTKKPRLEDFKSSSESEGESGDADEHEITPLEHDLEALEHAHEMDASESSQDAATSFTNEDHHSPSLNDDIIAHNEDEIIAYADQKPEPKPGSEFISQPVDQLRKRHYGLLGERAASPFDDDMWKDWILTPLELRHSQAPREPEYDGFPGPGSLPPIPCVVRFDIVNRYPAKSLCMIGCARSDVSNGWVVTHSKSLIIDMDDAREFTNAIRYRASETELVGTIQEDALRLEYHYPTVFENTIFEHPWLLDLQKRYHSTYALKSTLSEYQPGEILPRGSLTRNGSWNHRVQGDLTEDAGFIRRAEGNERDYYDKERKEAGKDDEGRKEEKRQGKKKITSQDEEPFDISSTRASSIMEPENAPLPRTYLLFAESPLSPLELAYPRPLDTPFPVEKQRVSQHEGLDLVTKVADTILQTENGDDVTESRSSTPLLQYPESEEGLSATNSNTTEPKRLASRPHPPPIFPSILPPSVIRPGEAFVELRTDQPDLWGYNDAESTLVRIQSAPIEPTQFSPLYSKNPPPHHPIWNDSLGRIERIRTMKLYDGDPWSFSSHIRENEFLDLNCDAGNDWLENGDTIIGSGVAELCARMRAEFIHPTTLQLFTDDEVQKGLNRRLQQAYFDFELPDRPHCILDSTLPLDAIPEFDTERDPQLRAGATLHTPPGNVFAEDSFFRSAYKDPSQSRFPQTRNNIWIYDIMRLRRLRLRTTQLLQHITDYLLRGSFRNHIDALPAENPVRHFFYHHCSIFRFLDPDIPVISQGFNQRCIHSLNDPHEPIYEEHPYPSDNPLLTIEEESYLAYVGKAFELAGRIPLCNAVRHLRRLTCFMEEDVRHLLSEGYLDPTYYYDGHGNRRAITWKFSDPADL